MEVIRNWLIGITCAAMLVALAEGITPDGAVKRIGKIAGGLILMLAIIQPVAGLDFPAMSAAMATYRVEAGEYSGALETENQRLIKAIIEDQSCAYIQDKAAGLGLSCTVEVTCQTQEDGTLYPAEVTITGMYTQEQQQQLQRMIEADFAIPTARQVYERTDVE